MNLSTELQYTLATFIGFMLESIFYGIYCVIFATFVGIQLKRTNNGSKALLYLVTVNFIACTAKIAVDAIASQSTVSLELIIASNALYICIDLISQIILIYRCYIIWRQPWVIVGPILLTLAFLAISVTTVVKTPSTDSKAAYKLLSSLVLSFFSLSLAENALVTGLIITKILRVTTYRQGDISPRLVGYASRLSRDIVRILIESGMITFMAQLVQILVYNFDNNAFLIIGGLVGQLFGISTAIVLVRVEMGLTYDIDNQISTGNNTVIGPATPSKDDAPLHY